MTSIAQLKRMLPLLSALLLGTGCTAGVLVDDNFKNISSNGSVTFFQLDANDVPTGTTYTFYFKNQPYLSFDAFASDGATTSSYPGLVNSSQYLPTGNYYAEYFQAQVGFAKSNNFHHQYDGKCTDPFTGNSDSACEQYFLQLSYAATCHGCGGQFCPPPATLPTYLGLKVIQMCAHYP